MPSTSRQTCSRITSATVRGILIGGSGLTPALRDQPPLSGPMNGIARQFPARPEPIFGLSDIAQPPDIHLVGLRRSLVRLSPTIYRVVTVSGTAGDSTSTQP